MEHDTCIVLARNMNRRKTEDQEFETKKKHVITLVCSFVRGRSRSCFQPPSSPFTIIIIFFLILIYASSSVMQIWESGRDYHYSSLLLRWFYFLVFISILFALIICMKNGPLTNISSEPHTVSGHAKLS
jgi:hypothetical protein